MNLEKTPASQEEKYIMMTDSPLEPLIIRLAVPAIVSALVTSLYNMADTYFIGKLGTSATGAIGIVFAVMEVIQAFGFFFGQGSGNNIAKELGKKDGERAQMLASTSFYCALMFGMLLIIIGWIWTVPILNFIGTTETIMPYAIPYMRVILLGAPFMMASLTMNVQYRFVGNAMLGMIGLGIGAVINIGLDPILIYGCHMGITGAALATILSQMAGFGLLLYYNRKAGNTRISLKKFSFSGCFREIFRGGVPSLCRHFVSSIATIFLNVASKPYGDALIASMGIINRIMGFSNSAMIGLGQGMQPVCGYCYGARKGKRVQEALMFVVKMGFVILTITAVLEFVFAKPLITLFQGNDPAVIKMGAEILKIRCVTLPLTALSMPANMLMQTLGYAFMSSAVGMCRQGLILIPAVTILPKFLGMFGVEVAQSIADVISFVITIPCILSILRKMKKLT